MSFGTAPTIPTALQQYNSYEEDPKWQTKFTIAWCAVLAAAVVFNAPARIRRLRSDARGAGARARTALFGLQDDWGNQYEKVSVSVAPARIEHRRTSGLLSAASAWALYSPPGTGLTLAQILLAAGYFSAILGCMLTSVPLISNPNRAGFLALAQLPPVFLFATKNSILSALLGGAGAYDKLNYVHRWAGRGLYLAAVVHGALWIRNHVQYDLPVLGSEAPKETYGVAALACLSLVVLFSLRPVRAYAYQAFFVTHVCLYVAFFVCTCYHTIYASPWIFPPLALYGADVLARMVRFRIRRATLVPVGNQMTLIKVHGSAGQHAPGAHFRVRVLAGGHILESHPLTIASAPPSHTVAGSRDLLLAARASGDWSRSLSAYAQSEVERLALADPKTPPDVRAGADVTVTLDGPYGGLSVDLGEYESVMLVAGGAGMSAVLGALDDLVGRITRLGRARGERTARVSVVWYVRSFGTISWFASALSSILHAAGAPAAGLDVHLSVFVTCLCAIPDVPHLPNSAVSVARPAVAQLLSAFLSPTLSPTPSAAEDGLLSARAVPTPADAYTPEKKDVDVEDGSEEDAPVPADAAALAPAWRAPHAGGGAALVVAGPEGLCAAARSAVAGLGPRAVRRAGGVRVSAEVFAL